MTIGTGGEDVKEAIKVMIYYNRVNNHDFFMLIVKLYLFFYVLVIY